jgi:hypothetical protein
LDIVVHQSPPILQLVVVKKQPLLMKRDALFFLDLSLDIGDGVRALHLKHDDNISRPGFLMKICIIEKSFGKNTTTN